MTGRFLDLMPNEFYQTLKQLNSIENEKILKVENTDAAFFNANNHPLLLDFELVINKSLKKERIKKQLLMSDLFIRKRDNELIIWHKKLNKQVQIFDLGIQTPKGRSPLYQFLQNFSTPIPSLYYLELAIERFEKQLNLKNQFSPSIVFEDWILKRNTWKIPNLGKMEQIGSFSNLKLYQNWLNWRLKNNFLQKDYFIKSTKNTDNQLFKNRKPTYISFNNLMLQHNSFYQKEKEVEPLQIQGMKPDETELLKISEQKYISEFVLQWYNI